MNRETFPFISYSRPEVDPNKLISNSREFYRFMDERRSCRDFSKKDVPQEVIENLIRTASSAPSGAHKQPWHFVAVSNPQIKSEIRKAAEIEEREFYEKRAPKEWLEDLAPIGTDWHKEFLEIAPWLIIAFRRTYDMVEETRRKNYYVQESVGLACGFLISAIHNAGLVTLTHTPSPMNFLSEILDRPENEKPFLLLPVGYAAPDAKVPDLQRKSLEQVSNFML